jgi:hypothetical protein
MRVRSLPSDRIQRALFLGVNWRHARRGRQHIDHGLNLQFFVNHTEAELHRGHNKERQ